MSKSSIAIGKSLKNVYNTNLNSFATISTNSLVVKDL